MSYVCDFDRFSERSMDSLEGAQSKVIVERGMREAVLPSPAELHHGWEAKNVEQGTVTVSIHSVLESITCVARDTRRATLILTMSLAAWTNEK